ncbi:uncharacterized protein [Diadema setosum]|uniref:uncharacterized protein n=1 Tax=Diadema setosum TaxID=31175 RepID=UPI003B3A603B
MLSGPSVDEEGSVVGTVPYVVAWKGEDIRLPCDLQEEPFAVYWVKEMISGQQETMAGFFDGKFVTVEKRFNIYRNFSLVITNLNVADEGLYLCQVALSNLQIFGNSTLMTVNSKASKHEIEKCIRNSQSDQSRCTYQTTSDVSSITLKCVVSGFKPNVSMLWTDESGKRVNSTVSRQTTLDDNTYKRFETISVSAKRGTEQTFLCKAIGESLNGTSIMGITVLPLSGKRNNLSLIIGLAIGVPVAVVILFLVVAILLPKHYPEDLQKDLFSSYSSLTKEQVQQCKEELKAYYRKTRRKTTVDPLNFMELVDLDEIYTNLSLIDQSGIRKIPITYNDLLTNYGSGNLSQHILIQGEGGVGKTTLCSKIAWDWCHRKILQNLDMVLLIPLRKVTVGSTIGDIVKKYLPDSNLVKPEQINNYISQNSDSVLLVFDGFDEFDETLEERSSSEVIRILGLEQYQSCKVIVTTRPWRRHEFTMARTLADAYTYISVEGFNAGNVSTYIKRYFRIREKDNLAETLIRFMEENDVIRSNMAPFPIFCAMLCLMWNEFSEERQKEMQKMQTFSQIFGEMIFFLEEHYASKFCENLQNRNAVRYVKDASRAIQEIGDTALAGIIERKLSFPEEHFTKCQNAMEICRKVGVLTKEQDIIIRKLRRDANTSSFVESTVSFPHKLFQEYVAGVHIEYLYSNDRAKYNQIKNKLVPHFKEFRYLLYFASASRNDLGLDIINDLINCSDRDFCVDIAFECHTKEAARAVGKKWQEYEISSNTSAHTKSAVVFMGSCDQAQSLHITNVNFGRAASLDLAKGLCSSCVLCKVDILITHLHSDFYMIVGADSSNCQIQHLNLSFDSFDDNLQHHSSMGVHLAKWVCSMPRLSTLSVTSPYFPDKFLSTAVDLASSCRLEHLKLRIYIWETGRQPQSSMGKELAEWVCYLPHLSSFGVECYYLSDNFFSTAVDLAQHCQIREIHMATSMDWKSEPGAAGNLAKFLCRMPNLTLADLQCDYLPKEFFKTVVSQKTCSKVDTIQDLSLSFEGLDEDSQRQSSLGVDLARWVCTMPNLLCFRLTTDYLPDDLLSTAADLASSCQIRELSLEIHKDWTPRPAAAINLAEFLCRMPHVVRADLQCHNLSREFHKTVASEATSTDSLIDHLIVSMDLISSKHPNAGFILFGDFSELDVTPLTASNGFAQVVDKPTRGQILGKITPVVIEGLRQGDFAGNAGQINESFINVAKDIDKLNLTPLPSFLPTAQPTPLFQPWEVYRELRSINPRKASGPDSIPAKIITEFAYELSNPLTHLINASFNDTTVPKQSKRAIIVPIPKKNPSHPLKISDQSL